MKTEIENPTNSTGMITRVNYDPADRQAWLQMRRIGLGGSDAATITGHSPWSSLLELYYDKKGLLPEREDNEAMRQGRDLEDYVARRWEEATGKRVARVNAILYNMDYPFAFANIDRRVVGEKALLECKTTSVYNKTDFEGGDIPPHFYIQCQHYLAVTDYERAYLAVLVLNKGFYTFTIERDDAEIAALMQMERDFWDNHIAKNVPPAPDGSDSAQAILDMQARSDGTEIMPDMESVFEEYERVSGMVKEYQDDKDNLRQQIIARMGDKERGKAQTWSCSYLNQERTGVDKNKLMRLFPDAYRECMTTSNSRTFRVKKDKGEA